MKKEAEKNYKIGKTTVVPVEEKVIIEVEGEASEDEEKKKPIEKYLLTDFLSSSFPIRLKL